MAFNPPDGLFFDLVNAKEVELAHEIEKKAFPSSEAGSLETFKKRQFLAPKLFLGAFIPPRILLGYANATLASSSTLTHDAMAEHDPKGTSVCIHALVVSEDNRRKGIAMALMKEYIHRLREDPKTGEIVVQRILLICHENLIPFYKRAGLELKGKSSVIHGPDPWFEMGIELGLEPEPQPHVLEPAADGSIPADILAALTSPSRNRPSARPYASLSKETLISPLEENQLDILCPRCGSVILKAGAAKHRRKPGYELDPAGRPPPPPLEILPPPPNEIDWWLVTPSPMVFENIAFSRPVLSDNLTLTSPRMKLLACAECDLGAFGMCEEGGKEYWIAASRVGYR